MKVLLTNDDGVESEALIPTIECVKSLGWEVEVIVPEGQRSGYSKATTRRGMMRLEMTEKGGHSVQILNGGTPADCVNLGIYKGRRPDLVVSGANIGSNLDVGHYFSSGTIGAAIEGLLLGIPAVAVSLCYTEEELIEENFRKALNPLPDLLEIYIEEIPFQGMSVNYPLSPKVNGYHASFLGYPKVTQLFKIEDAVVSMKKQKWTYTPEECERGSDRWAISKGSASLLGINQLGFPVATELVEKWLKSHNLGVDL